MITRPLSLPMPLPHHQMAPAACWQGLLLTKHRRLPLLEVCLMGEKKRKKRKDYAFRRHLPDVSLVAAAVAAHSSVLIGVFLNLFGPLGQTHTNTHATMLELVLHTVRTVARRCVAASVSLKLTLLVAGLGLRIVPPSLSCYLPVALGKMRFVGAKCWCGYIRCGDLLSMARSA